MTKAASKVRMSRRALSAMMKESKRSAQRGLETGGALFGLKGEDGQLTILFALRPGPNAIRTAAMFEKDAVFTAQKFVKLRESTGLSSMVLIGDWHLHPITSISSGDERTLRNVCSSFPGYLALIVCGLRERQLRVFTVIEGQIVELELEIIEHDEATPAKPGLVDYERTQSFIDPKVANELSVAVFGCGSGGSVVAYLMGKTGIGSITLADGDRLTRANFPRHIGQPSQLNMLKTDIVMSRLRQDNPNITVETIDEALSAETRQRYAEAIAKSDYVVACTGSASCDHMVQQLCRELNKPATFGGAFERASGGLAFAFDPENSEGGCINCLFEQTRNLQGSTNEIEDHQRHDYGLSEDELSAQQGLFVDIGIVAHLVTKVAITHLARGASQNLPDLPGNLVVWSNESFSTQWANVTRRSDCSVCNPAGWRASRMSALPSRQAEPIL